MNPTPLRDRLYPPLAQLAAGLEQMWQQWLELAPYPVPEDLGYVEGTLEGDRLTIVNSCYQTSQFRKIHLELAKVGQNLDILHCVMFPRPAYGLPILGLDLVAGPKGIGAAIVDLSPVGLPGEPLAPGEIDRRLPPAYITALGQLSRPTFSQPRPLPAWGDIFSEFCVFVRPSPGEEEQQFIALALAYGGIHCQQAIQAQPGDGATVAAVTAAQERYCHQQQQNDKTRRILEQAFGAEWADRYLKTLLFDGPGPG